MFKSTAQIMEYFCTNGCLLVMLLFIKSLVMMVGHVFKNAMS